MKRFSDEDIEAFSNQLESMGVQLREVAGDGNCLFRALGDQLEGHSHNHLKHRQKAIAYMIKNRNDFEPFIEDDATFEEYVDKLQQDGTYAGNDAIVAFARLYKVKVVIHQLCAPVWIIDPNSYNLATELHIAYHNGDHYSSVRKIGDHSSHPAKIYLADLQRESEKREKECNIDRYVQEIAEVTECHDYDTIEELLERYNYDFDRVVMYMTENCTDRRHNEPLEGHSFTSKDFEKNIRDRASSPVKFEGHADSIARAKSDASTITVPPNSATHSPTAVNSGSTLNSSTFLAMHGKSISCVSEPPSETRLSCMPKTKVPLTPPVNCRSPLCKLPNEASRPDATLSRLSSDGKTTSRLSQVAKRLTQIFSSHTTPARTASHVSDHEIAESGHETPSSKHQISDDDAEQHPKDSSPLGLGSTTSVQNNLPDGVAIEESSKHTLSLKSDPSVHQDGRITTLHYKGPVTVTYDSTTPALPDVMVNVILVILCACLAYWMFKFR